MKIKLIAAVFITLSVLTRLYAIERDDVYRLPGRYSIASRDRIRLYFPENSRRLAVELLPGLIRVRNRMDEVFPEQKNFEAIVILSDHDDRVSSQSDPDFDLITLGLFEETNSLSTRGYSLEERFALRLAHIMILRTLGPARAALKRRLALLSIPPWFMEGMASYYAFPNDALRTARILDLARNDKIYTLSDLDLILTRSISKKEEMVFQAHAMIDYWHSTSEPDAGKKLMFQIRSKPAQFSELFKRVFKLSLKSAYDCFVKEMKKRCEYEKCDALPDPEPMKIPGKADFFQSLRIISDTEKVWVSSARYTEETYDLWYQKDGERARVLLSNVHPSLIVDQKRGTVFIGRYIVDSSLQRRLTLWATTPKSKPVKIVSKPASFKPAAVSNDRVYFFNVSSGQMSLMTANIDGKGTPSVEYIFPAPVRPVDFAVAPEIGKIAYVVKASNCMSLVINNLSCISSGKTVFSAPTRIRNPYFDDSGALWFCAETEDGSVQLMRHADNEVRQFSKIAGGVWDYTFTNDSMIVTTVESSSFRPVVMPLPSDINSVLIDRQCHDEICDEKSSSEIDIRQNASSGEFETRPYRKEYLSNYWLPKISTDDQGNVFGIYSYREDRLGRSRVSFSPTYGFKSKNWGYTGTLGQRFGQLNTDFYLKDSVVRKSYLSNTYYERERTHALQFALPLTLALTLQFGLNLTDRKIAKFPENGGITPSVGRDNSFYAYLLHKGIRTEPYWDIFPQRGRIVEAGYRKGIDVFGGEMRYDSFSLRWTEFIPLKRRWVMTSRVLIAEDNKSGGIRRPEDLTLGGADFMRGYAGSFRYGDSLRAFSIHFGHPIPVKIPVFNGLLHKEIIIAEAFWERGDVRTNRRFDFQDDIGLELRGRFLIMKRIPLTLRCGMAWPQNGEKARTYVQFDVATLKGLVQ